MQYDVPLIPQATGMGCWAASIAMILSWQNEASFDPGMIAANPGGISYVPNLQSGLNPNDQYILSRNGFALEPPQCYTAGAVYDLLKSYGPLWVACLTPLPPRNTLEPHIRVVTGMDGGTLSVNDPWPVNRGARYRRPFTFFFGEMETLGDREMKERNPVYVAYLDAG